MLLSSLLFLRLLDGTAAAPQPGDQLRAAGALLLCCAGVMGWWCELVAALYTPPEEWAAVAFSGVPSMLSGMSREYIQAAVRGSRAVDLTPGQLTGSCGHATSAVCCSGAATLAQLCSTDGHPLPPQRERRPAFQRPYDVYPDTQAYTVVALY